MRDYNDMKTPYLDEKINELEIHENSNTISEMGLRVLAELKAIKKQLENNPIVSTPDNPVWVVDEWGNKRILIVDLGEAIEYRYILVKQTHTDKFLKKGDFLCASYRECTPYTEKVSIEVTKDEAVKVKEFLKTLRNGN